MKGEKASAKLNRIFGESRVENRLNQVVIKFV